MAIHFILWTHVIILFRFAVVIISVLPNINIRICTWKVKKYIHCWKIVFLHERFQNWSILDNIGQLICFINSRWRYVCPWFSVVYDPRDFQSVVFDSRDVNLWFSIPVILICGFWSPWFQSVVFDPRDFNLWFLIPVIPICGFWSPWSQSVVGDPRYKSRANVPAPSHPPFERSWRISLKKISTLLSALRRS